MSIKANTDGLLEIIDMLVELGWIVQPEADTLDGCSWANIDKVAATGKAPNFWAVGDCKKITLNGTVGTLALDNYDTYVYIIDFDHDGTPNTIDFGTFKTSASGGKDVCLIEQDFVKNPDITVEQLVNDAILKIGEKITIRRFARFVMGEGLEKKNENFAEEIDKQIKA